MLAYYSYLVASTVGVGCYYYQATSLLPGSKKLNTIYLQYIYCLDWTYKEGAAAGEERRDELELERRPVRFGLEDSGSVWG